MKVQTKEEEVLFGKFNVIECLKKDDNSSVYLATDIHSRKKVILKLLNTINLPDQSILERFKREAKVLVNIDHPNVIKVLDFGTHNNFFFTSFEFFESSNLRAIIRENKLTDEQKKKLVIQLFTGLDFAHKNHIIHRDIKPENILVSKNLDLKIGDFGLALSINDSFVTSQFHIVGTPSYMSPEQIRGDKLTSRSDLFSAGIVTYELFSGINPFLGKDVNDTLNKIISWDVEKLNELPIILPDDIHDLITGLLHNDPDQRIENASTVIDILSKKTIGKSRKRLRRKTKLTGYILLSFLLLFILTYLIIKEFYYLPVSIATKHPGNDTLTNKQISETVKKENTNNLPDLKKDQLKAEVIIPVKADKKEPPINQVNTVQMPVIKKTGSLFVECLPWAYIYIDSSRTDITPLKNSLVLTEGEHFVQLVHPNYPTWSGKIRISENRQANIKINLDTLFAFLDCKVNPWCEIYVDGKLKGQTPLQFPLKIMPGKHHISLKNSEFSPVDYDIKSNQGETYTIRYNFKKDY
jgi:eukaryotic-like serine/threonine-protein kinase